MATNFLRLPQLHVWNDMMFCLPCCRHFRGVLYQATQSTSGSINTVGEYLFLFTSLCMWTYNVIVHIIREAVVVWTYSVIVLFASSLIEWHVFFNKLIMGRNIQIIYIQAIVTIVKSKRIFFIILIASLATLL